jgi:hypothetical protein
MARIETGSDAQSVILLRASAIRRKSLASGEGRGCCVLHLTFKHSNAIEVAFDGTGTVRQGNPRSGGVEASAQAPEEGPQRRLPGSVDSSHPGGEAAATAVSHDLGDMVDHSRVVVRAGLRLSSALSCSRSSLVSRSGRPLPAVEGRLPSGLAVTTRAPTAPVCRFRGGTDGRTHPPSGRRQRTTPTRRATMLAPLEIARRRSSPAGGQQDVMTRPESSRKCAPDPLAMSLMVAGEPLRENVGRERTHVMSSMRHVSVRTSWL